MEKNDQEKATNNETRKHILVVNELIGIFITQLLERAKKHDLTKLDTPELEHFAELTPKLSGCAYGSEEYKGFLKDLKPALDHHYAKNSHHPEHYENGIDGMNLLDLVELFCDWKASTLRGKDGNLEKSLDINAKRFNICPQLASILRNTIKVLEKESI